MICHTVIARGRPVLAENADPRIPVLTMVCELRLGVSCRSTTKFPFTSRLESNEDAFLLRTYCPPPTTTATPRQRPF